MSAGVWIALIGVGGTLIASSGTQVLLFWWAGKRETTRWAQEMQRQREAWDHQRVDSWFDERRQAYMRCLRAARTSRQQFSADVSWWWHPPEGWEPRAASTLPALREAVSEMEMVGSQHVYALAWNLKESLWHGVQAMEMLLREGLPSAEISDRDERKQVIETARCRNPELYGRLLDAIRKEIGVKLPADVIDPVGH